MSKGSETATSYAHQRGAAYSVSSALAGIQFVPGSQGGMSAAVAYIQYWSRKGTQQRVSLGAQQGAAAGGATPPSQGLSQSLSGVTPPSQAIALQVVPFGAQTQPPPPPPPEPILLEAPPQTVSRTILTVPTNPLQQAARPRQPVPTTVQSPVTAPAKAGPIYSANPGGVVAPPSSNPFYTPAQSEYPPPANAAWQFLFNPEELQLSSGPDFNRAESWGVSDRANSGQPLSWRSNRNRKLSFGKIVLHGYTIGKRVDSLEEGLQKLFEARDGDGQDGPPVLEFVWGPRVFGPCVIQNIQVREKAWDKGVLVNAEVSFELEQVPEWTINDGFVDILRPGRQPSINDPIAPSSAFRPGEGEGSDLGEDERPPATQPGGQPPPSGSDPTLCNFAVKQSAIFQSLFDRASNLLNVFNILFISNSDFSSKRGALYEDFVKAKSNFYSASKEIGGYVDSKLRSKSPGCINSNFKKTLLDITSQSGISFEEISFQQFKFIRACSAETKKYIDEWQRTSPKCKEQRVAGQQTRLSEERAKRCESYSPGKPCSANLAIYSGCSSFNGGKPVKCVNGVWVSL